jgi:hypothetical protein
LISQSRGLGDVYKRQHSLLLISKSSMIKKNKPEMQLSRQLCLHLVRIY